MINTKRTYLANWLFDLGAVKDRLKSPGSRGFKLKLHEKNPAAPLSPIYFNLRTPDNPKPGPLIPAIVRELASVFHEMKCELRASGILVPPPRYVVGVPRAGDPLADALAEASYGELSVLYLTKQEGEHGRRIGGFLPGSIYKPGARVILVDDLITEADSKIEALEALRAAGLLVDDVFVVVDREQGGVEVLRQHNCRVHRIFTLSELLEIYRECRKMPAFIYTEIKEYLAAERTVAAFP